MPRIAFYPGSFDPVTNGHLDVVTRACRLADRLVVAIGTHHGKTPLFSAEERLEMLREVCAPIARAEGAELEVTTFGGLVTKAALDADASILVRGLRDGADFEYEMQMVGMNAALAPTLETVFLPAGAAVRSIGATFVRQIAAMGGDVSAFVPEAVERRLKTKFST